MRPRAQQHAIDPRQRRQVIYFFKSPVGVFQILQNIRGRWELWLDDERHGFYGSPMAAADDVHMRATGAPGWDGRRLTSPGSLGEWQKTFR